MGSLFEWFCILVVLFVFFRYGYSVGVRVGKRDTLKEVDGVARAMMASLTDMYRAEVQKAQKVMEGFTWQSQPDPRPRPEHVGVDITLDETPDEKPEIVYQVWIPKSMRIGMYMPRHFPEKNLIVQAVAFADSKGWPQGMEPEKMIPCEPKGDYAVLALGENIVNAMMAAQVHGEVQGDVR